MPARFVQRHLTPVPAPAVPIRPEQQSLRFCLIAARQHAENGDFDALLTAICDVVWIQHTGEHEQVSDREVVAELSAIGASWEPPGEDG